MLVDIPEEWRQYFLKNAPHLRTFRKDTPQDIIEKAKMLNEKMIKLEGDPFYWFEEEDDAE